MLLLFHGKLHAWSSSMAYCCLLAYSIMVYKVTSIALIISAKGSIAPTMNLWLFHMSTNKDHVTCSKLKYNFLPGAWLLDSRSSHWNGTKSNSSVFSRVKRLQYSLRTSELMFVFPCFWRAVSESAPWRVFPINCGGCILHHQVQNSLQAAAWLWHNWARSGTGSNLAVIACSSAWAPLIWFLGDSAKLMHHFPRHH